jgi:hypothetical protein
LRRSWGFRWMMLSLCDVYLEIGSKRTFAGALDWPGWCRSNRDESSALSALVAYGPRYARVLRTTGLGFQPPADSSALSVVERLTGNTSTDFGSPAVAPSADARPLSEAEVQRLTAILEACWRTFDEAVSSAQGKVLRTGPRGGGRDVEHIFQHVLEADAAYLGRLGWHFKTDDATDSAEALLEMRQTMFEALSATAPIGIPGTGPRGGARWHAAYFVRRVAWHALDHAWEIEDRLV